MKKKYSLAVLAIAGFSCLMSCKKTDAPPPNVEKNLPFDMISAKTAIETQGEIFVSAMNKKDSVGLANCYTTDAKLMQPNANVTVGRQNIQKVFGQWMKAGLPKFAMKTVEVWGNENEMMAEEEWTFSDNEGKVLDKGKALELFKMENGKWKLHRDCYNSDMPLAK